MMTSEKSEDVLMTHLEVATWRLFSRVADPHRDPTPRSRSGCLEPGAGVGEAAAVTRVRPGPDLEPDLATALFCSILLMTASHLPGFRARGVLARTFSSFSVSMAWTWTWTVAHTAVNEISRYCQSVRRKHTFTKIFKYIRTQCETVDT